MTDDEWGMTNAILRLVRLRRQRSISPQTVSRGTRERRGRLFLPALHCYPSESFIFARIFMCRSRRDFCELIDVSLAGSKQRGDDAAALLGEQPAVRAADFLEQSMCAE